MAEDQKAVGNKLYSESKFEEAIEKYSSALSMAPEVKAAAKQRSTYFSNRAACHVRLHAYEDAIHDCSAALDLQPEYVKALVRRATAYETLEEWERSELDAKKILELEPSNANAKSLLARVGPKAEAKREELKEEMITKLKDLGNTVLGKFGMSLDNFKAEKDPNTGSYSIKFAK